MVYYSDSDIVIRNMNYSDIPFIIVSEIEQGEQVDLEKYLYRLRDQEKLKNIVLVAEYKDIIAKCECKIVGYISIYPFSHNGPFKCDGYSEIVDLKIFDKYKNLGLEDKLMKVAEKVGAEYSSVVYLGCSPLDGELLNKYIQRGYMPHKSGMWYKNKLCRECPNAKLDNDLVLWLYKRHELTNVHKLPVICTPKRPSLRWLSDKLKTVYVHINIEKCEEIKVEDNVILEDINSNDCVICKVVFKHEYDTYEDLIRAEGVKNILPFLNDDNINDDDVEKAIQYFNNFPGTELVKKYGCVAFGIKIIGSNE